ncbi:MAG: phosphonate ABC transporter ATP-binding protein [Beijerinckiaceae bacterium]
MSALLEVRGLTKAFGPVAALRGVSLTVRPGEFVAVLGPSGSGKSTLFRCVTRLTEPDSGEVHLNGRPLHDLRGGALRDARRDIGVVFQQFNLIRRRSALENVLTGRLARLPLWRVALGRFGQHDTARAARALAAVGLAAARDQRADTLSGGQQQRVAIARALAQESRLLLADEPVASLDPDTARSVLTLMRELVRREGLAVLCTLHQPHLAEEFGDRVLSMTDGRLTAS